MSEKAAPYYQDSVTFLSLLIIRRRYEDLLYFKRCAVLLVSLMLEGLDTMNRRNMALGGSLAVLAAAAATLSSAPASADSTGDVLAAIEEYRKAMVDGNGARLLEMSADDMSFGHANGVVQTKVEFVKTVVDKVEVFHGIKLYDHSIRVSGDLAIARHTFDADVFFQGKDQNFLLSVVQTWRKEDGRWRLFLRQSFKPLT
jgi:ketosteroid isomerase-like protein